MRPRALKTPDALSGHLTDAVFDRYDIVDEVDLAAAAKLIQNKHKLGTKGNPVSGGKPVKALWSTVREWRNWQTRKT